MSKRVHKIKQVTRQQAYKATNGLCWYCGQVATTIDHGQPLSKGGSKKINNLYPSCNLCNQKKEDMDVVQFRKWLIRKGNHYGTKTLSEGKFYGELSGFVLGKQKKQKLSEKNNWIYGYLGIEKI